MPRPSPFLNIDAGESDDEPEELYSLAHAVSVACGGHAGDTRSMERVLRACKAHGTRVGAHPSYEDREGFGRRELTIDREALFDGLLRQMRTLEAIATRVDWPVTHVKAHGALYHAAHRDPETAAELVAAVKLLVPGSHTMVGQPGGALERLATRTPGFLFLREGFADRARRPDGSLVPRGEPGAVITDPEVARAQARVLAASGAFDTLCVHGDTKNAVAIARAVREELDAFAASG